MAGKGLLIVVSGPSGAGKGTLCQALLDRNPLLRFSVSVTTRPRRAGEVDGVHYFFWSDAEFEEAVNRNYFLEWARVYGRLYGTPLEPIETWRAAGTDVLLDLDIQGARQVKQRMPDAVLVFIMPPSLDALRVRIAQRGTENEAERRLRLEAASEFVKAAVDFDYLILNDTVEEAVRSLEAITVAEHARATRQMDVILSFTERVLEKGVEGT